MSDQAAPLPFCGCGCGQAVRKPTSKFLHGHHIRLNNPSSRPDIKEKRRVSMKKRHEDGVMPEPWNKGKKASDDPRLAAQGKSRSAAFTDKEREMHADLLRKNRKTFYGPDHPNWKGGVSGLTEMLRGNYQLHQQWKRPILIRDGFRCTICKRGSLETKLAVHHDKERFADIMFRCLQSVVGERVMEERTWEEKVEVCQRVVDYHIENKVSGVTLCYDCHGKVHETEKDED